MKEFVVPIFSATICPCFLLLHCGNSLTSHDEIIFCYFLYLANGITAGCR